MNKAHKVQIISFTGPLMRLKVDGKDYEIDLASESPRLAKASQKEREHVEISPAGYGLHWPDLDEDLSIDGLIGVEHQSPVARARA